MQSTTFSLFANLITLKLIFGYSCFPTLYFPVSVATTATLINDHLTICTFSFMAT